jgi:hypothetical protein
VICTIALPMASQPTQVGAKKMAASTDGLLSPLIWSLAHMHRLTRGGGDRFVGKDQFVDKERADQSTGRLLSFGPLQRINCPQQVTVTLAP